MIFYFYGDNEYSIHKQVESIKNKYLAKTGQDADYIQIDSTEQDFNFILNSVAAQPMFVTSRLVIVQNITNSKFTTEQIEELMARVSESTVLVLTDNKPDKRTSIFKRLTKLSSAKDFHKLPRPKLEQWVLTEAKKYGLKIDQQSISYLIDRVGENQWQLQNDIQKLSAWEGEISRKLIDSLTTPSLEHSSFDLAEALVVKDYKRALKLYDELTFQGQADQMIFGAIVFQYRMLMLAKINNSDLNKAYKASPYALQKARQAAGRVELEDIKKSYLLLRSTDMAIKSGELSSTEAIKSLLIQLCR